MVDTVLAPIPVAFATSETDRGEVTSKRLVFHLALHVASATIIAMFIRRLQNLPILCLLIISLLISQAVTSGYAWGATADNHSLRKEAVAGACASDNYVANTAYRWGHSHPRQGHQSDSLLADITPTTVLVHIPLPECNFNIFRVVDTSPRISDHILRHRTIVLLI